MGEPLKKANEFLCRTCMKPFTVPPAALQKYPGWVPKQCLKCKNSRDTSFYDEEDMADTCHPGHPSNYGDS